MNHNYLLKVRHFQWHPSYKHTTKQESDQKIGFITPHTHNFCELCNRVRITCTGEMYMCLGQQDKADLKTPLRKSENNQLLKDVIYEAISRKPKGHDFDYSRQMIAGEMTRHMSHTGG